MLLDVGLQPLRPPKGQLPALVRAAISSKRAARHPLGVPPINFDGPDSAAVRQFFIHNALYWLEGVSTSTACVLDAIHAVHGRGERNRHIVNRGSLPRGAQRPQGRSRQRFYPQRSKNLDNAVALPRWPRALPRNLRRGNGTTDAHHCLHVLLSGEAGVYYLRGTYAPPAPRHCLCRAPWRRASAYPGRALGLHTWAGRVAQSSRHLPPSAFVNFLQNHDPDRQSSPRRAAQPLWCPDEAGACAPRHAVAGLLAAPRTKPLPVSWARSGAAIEPFPVVLRLSSRPSRQAWFAHRSREFPGAARIAAGGGRPICVGAPSTGGRLEEPRHARRRAAIPTGSCSRSGRRDDRAADFRGLRARELHQDRSPVRPSHGWSGPPGEQVLRPVAPNLRRRTPQRPLVGSASGRVDLRNPGRPGAALTGRQTRGPGASCGCWSTGRESR